MANNLDGSRVCLDCGTTWRPNEPKLSIVENIIRRAKVHTKVEEKPVAKEATPAPEKTEKPRNKGEPHKFYEAHRAEIIADLRTDWLKDLLNTEGVKDAT